MKMKNILVIGGGGYVGAALVPSLLRKGYFVTVYDLFLYGTSVIQPHENLRLIVGDLRDLEKLENSLQGNEVIIHLACISNDPSFELNAELGKSVNYDCFEPLIMKAKSNGTKRFIYASSSSVYGIKEEPDVTEEMSLKPLTDYSKYKALCEEVLIKHSSHDFECVIVRPATVCGFSPRQRLDVIVNMFASQAYFNQKITIFGGDQLRPNIHIKDMVRLYCQLIEADSSMVSGQIFNAGYENLSVRQIAEIIKSSVNKYVEISITPTNDNRSYHISSQKLSNILNFSPKYTVSDAATEMFYAFEQRYFSDPMFNPSYYNIQLMKNTKLL